MPKIKMFCGDKSSKYLIEKHGFEAVPFREPTPKENVFIENIENFIAEAEELGMLGGSDGLTIEDFLLTLLVLNTSTENK